MGKVSIIIPVYNVSMYIDQCVESVCKQSYSNIEIILVDDGSIDDSGLKCDYWAEQDLRIKVLHKENGGLSSARNAGLDIATGEYIYFLDSDDYIEENLLEKVIPFFSEGYDMIAFEFYALYSNGKINPMDYHEEGIYEISSKEKKFDFLTNIILKGKIGWEACTRIFRKDIIEKNNLRFENNKKIFAEDLYFSLCYCLHANKIISLKKLFYYYRQREDSIMGKDSIKLNVGRMNELGKAVLSHYSKHEKGKEIITVFPVIYYMILDTVVEKYNNQKKLKLKQLRKCILNDLEDKDFFNLQLEQLKNHEDTLELIYSKVKTKVILSTVKYYLDGNYIFAYIRYQLIRIYAKLKFLKNWFD